MSSLTETQTAAAEQEWLADWQRGPTRTRWTSLPIQASDAAPDLELTDSSGSLVSMGNSWKEGPAVIIFLRHFGCGCAIERVDRLKNEYAGYRQAGAMVIAIGQGESERAQRFVRQRGLPCPLLCDPGRRAYEAYGLLEAKPSQVVYGMPEAFLRCDLDVAVDLQKSRHGTERAPVDSPWQLPGEFVIDRGGIIRLAYRSQFCADYADPQVLLAAIAEARLGL
jgi:peroxiredoxin